MIYTTPISSYNMQNAQQLGQMMQDQSAYTPSINPLSSSLTVPAGYSLKQWQQELSLAREQYFMRPLLAAGNLAVASTGQALMWTPLMSEMLPEAFGATMSATGRWVGGTSKLATGIGNAALGFNQAMHTFSVNVGTQIGEGLGWGIGQGMRGALRVGESTANYMSGGLLTRANEWLGATTSRFLGPERSFRFGSRLSGYLDRGAAKILDFSDKISGTLMKSEMHSLTQSKLAVQAMEKELAVARTMMDFEKEGALIRRLGDGPSLSKITSSLKDLRTKYKAAKASSAAVKGVRTIADVTKLVGGKVVGIAAAILNPAFLLKQAILDKAIDYGVEAYENYNTELEMNRELLAKGGRILRFGDSDISQGVDGGFTDSQRRYMVKHLKRMAANDFTVSRNDWFGLGSWSPFGGHKRYTENLRELKSLLSVSTDMGMFDMSKSLDEVEKRFDTIVKTVKKMSRITGKSKGELAMALASTQQAEARFDINDAAASLQRKIYAATASGASLQTILQESALGAQMGMQAGIGKAAGADFMILSRNMYSRMYRRGMLDRGDIDMMGGEQGVVSNLASGFMSMTNNNVFKSQLAMFFDPNTGRIDKKRMKEYLNGDNKSLRNSMIERHIAMTTPSYNSMTGMMEVGGEINAKMPFVVRALQHGDISQTDLLRMSKRFMTEAEMVYGKDRATRMMSSFFINNFGVDRGMLMMRAMKDESLLKPDLKEQMAVSKKQLEDRYNLEYQNANGAGFWNFVVTRGLVSGALASIPGIGPWLATAYQFNAGGSRHYVENLFLGWGGNAMSKEMQAVHAIGDWSESGISKVNRYYDAAYYAVRDKSIKHEDVTPRKRTLVNRMTEEYFKEHIYDKMKNIKGEDILKLNEAGNEDPFALLMSGEINEMEFKNRLLSDRNARIDIGLMLNNDNISELKNKSPFLRMFAGKTLDNKQIAVAKRMAYARAKLKMSNPELTDDQINKYIMERYNTAAYIFTEANDTEKDLETIRDLISTEKVGKYLSDKKKIDWWGTGKAGDYKEPLDYLNAKVWGDDTKGYLTSTMYFLPDLIETVFTFGQAETALDRLYEGGSDEAQRQKREEAINYLARLKDKGMEGLTSAEEKSVYARFWMSKDEYKEYLASKMGKTFDELSEDEKAEIEQTVTVGRAAGEKHFRRQGFFTQEKWGWDWAKADESYVREGEDLTEYVTERNRAMDKEEMGKLAQYLIVKGKDKRSYQEVYEDLIDSGSGKYKFEDKQRLYGEMRAEKATGNTGDAKDATEGSASDSEVGTGSSTLNRELLNVLKGLKTTMDNINVRFGGSNVPEYTDGWWN